MIGYLTICTNVNSFTPNNWPGSSKDGKSMFKNMKVTKSINETSKIIEADGRIFLIYESIIVGFI